MNRRNFFKLALGVIATAVIAPKTLLGAETANQRINLHHIALKLQQALEGHIGDFNDEITRRSVVNQTSALLEHYNRSNTINKYRVVCDRTNNTPELVDQNSLVADIYIQPTKETKFHQITCYIGPGRSFPIIKS